MKRIVTIVIIAAIAAATASVTAPAGHASGFRVGTPNGSPGAWLGSGTGALSSAYDISCTGSYYAYARGVALNPQRIGRSPGSSVTQEIWMQATLWSTTDFKTWSAQSKPWQKVQVDRYSNGKFAAEGWPQPTRSAYFLVQIEVRWYNAPSTTASYLGKATFGFTPGGIQLFDAKSYTYTDGEGVCSLN